MAVAIAQLNLPDGIQRLIHSYVFFSKKETLQRSHKRKLIHHLRQCERWCFTDGTFTDSEIIVMLGQNGTGKVTYF